MRTAFNHALLFALLATIVVEPKSSAAEAPPVPIKPLDLSAPDVTKMYEPEQLKKLLAAMETKVIADVEVEGKKDPRRKDADEPWGGIAAPVWALLHPTQSWRILAPVLPKQAEAMNAKPDATSTSRPPLRVCQMSPC